MKKKLFVVVAAFALTLAAPAAALASEGAQAMWRLYNPYTGEHFYTASGSERDGLVAAGWESEGEGWKAPETSKTPVYRLYNPYAPGGDHHYTMSAAERDSLVEAGWRYEGVGWYSDDGMSVPLYRQYNPYAATGSHNYTASAEERDSLVSLGWRDEGGAWYGSASSQPAHQNTWVTKTTWGQDSAAWDETVQSGTRTVVDQAAYSEKVWDHTEYVMSDGHVCGSAAEAEDYMYSTGCSYSGREVYRTINHPAVTH